MATNEQQPLLDPERQSTRESERPSFRERLAVFLESSLFHKIVITLIIIDTACVLADLAYTLLTPGCNTPGPEAPAWLEVLSIVSITISSFFLVEIPLTLFTLGPKHYDPLGDTPHAALHLFDALIIIATFVLEVILKGRERELASLLIVLRLWRLIKLVGGVAVGAGEIGEGDAKELAESRKQVDALRRQLSIMNQENAQLRARLHSAGLSVTAFGTE
ncbi:hypothetical protein AAF712_001354 [Marasmius tenuissimus]|uniref:Voltage-gated hydrogen channel 1 n=1 Tax=Marasmius tenuissimus TaxID=585030 RepID=A0ABR3ADP8_9AGAR|nr:hypothetical protein PM082_012950 [Marasmius tenuissimus]